MTLAGASSASAEAPDFGRCVKVAKGTGVYATGNCTTTEGAYKNYEWTPGPGPKPGFVLALKPETVLTFETSQHIPQRLNCFGATGTGEITGPRTISATITLTGCETAIECHSAGQPEKVIVLEGITGELGRVKAGETPLKDQIGLTLADQPSFGCANFGVSIAMSGSAIGTTSPTHSMATSRKWTLKRRMGKGLQVPERFEGGIPEGFTWSINGNSPEKVGLAAAFTLTSEEKIEINTVV